jgi:glycosyltransferase involved in cell wall biosynthesis
VDDDLLERCDFVEPVTIEDPGSQRRRSRRVARLALGVVLGRPVQVVDFASLDYAARLRRAVDEWRPDIVHLELEAMAQYLPLATSGGTVLVLVEPAVRTAYELWQGASGLERCTRFVDFLAWRRFERAIAGRADAVVALTTRDTEALHRVAGDAPVHTIPLATDLPAKRFDPVGAAPPTVVFVGGFGHPPNVKAAQRLALRIFPSVRAQYPDSVLFLVGDKPPAEVRALARADVVVTGRVPAVEPYLDRATVVAAPLDVGGGMRVKVLDALAGGKALVATPLAVEGLPLTDGEHALIAESDANFADALVRVLRDRTERERLASSAREWAERHLDPATAAAAYQRLYDEVLAGREPRRSRLE